MKLNLFNQSHKANTKKSNRLLSRDSRLKKVISVINYLNKSFENKYNVSIHRIHFNYEKLKELHPHSQGDILRVLNSNISKEGYKLTVLRTLREDLRFLIHIKAMKKKILTFSNNLKGFKGKLCIYKISSIAYKLIDDYFNNTKVDLYRKVKKEKDNLVTKNVTVFIKPHNNIYNKNSIKPIFKKNIIEKKLKLSLEITNKIKNIVKYTKNPEKTYKNTIYNCKDFFSYLSFDYKKEDILSFFISKLKEYKNKIHFMRQHAPYKTDFYILAGEFKDLYNSKWKTNDKKPNFSGHVKHITSNILDRILKKEF
ncbi:plasmid maintenance protein (plasmid) [Borreliella turdi]|uniref:plasmid maintenance protein n=1 Tax=Borreliella turdi TaxID=57863 RepID=UPI003AF153B6